MTNITAYARSVVNHPGTKAVIHVSHPVGGIGYGYGRGGYAAFALVLFVLLVIILRAGWVI